MGVSEKPPLIFSKQGVPFIDYYDQRRFRGAGYYKELLTNLLEYIDLTEFSRKVKMPLSEWAWYFIILL